MVSDTLRALADVVAQIEDSGGIEHVAVDGDGNFEITGHIDTDRDDIGPTGVGGGTIKE